jgi:hypothetical protein
MDMRALGLVIGAAVVISPMAAVADEKGTARTVIWMRGAPCGEINGTMTEPTTGGILVECSNGMIYGVMKTRDGSGWFLTKRNTLSGKFELY